MFFTVETENLPSQFAVCKFSSFLPVQCVTGYYSTSFPTTIAFFSHSFVLWSLVRHLTRLHNDLHSGPN